MINGFGLNTSAYSITGQQWKNNSIQQGKNSSLAVVSNPTGPAKSGMELQPKECQTCSRRRYQDGSDDPGVSMKTPTYLSPDQAASAVISHEMEHVFREQSEAQRENREVVNQSVQIYTAVCPECGRTYVSGGKTLTTTKAKPKKTMAIGDNSIDFYA